MLKRRLLLIVTLSVTVVLSILLLGQVYINRGTILSKLDASLTQYDPSLVQEESTPDKASSVDNPIPEFEDGKQPGGDIKKLDVRRISSVQFNLDGSVESVVEGDFTALETGDVEELAYRVLEEGKTKGTMGDYRYLVSENADTINVRMMYSEIEFTSISNNLFTSLIMIFVGAFVSLILASLLMKPMLRPAEESLEKQKRFITDASHELKTPLTIIETNTEISEMENGESKWTKSTHNQVERLRDLTNDLVTLTRMDERGQKIERKDTNLSTLVEDVAAMFEPSLQVKNAQLKLDINPDVYAIVNKEGIEQLLGILLENVSKYVNENGVCRVSVSQQGRHAVLSVFNTSDRVDKGEHPEYFERFYQSDESRNYKIAGYGIGLSVAQAIVFSNKGTIQAISADEKSLTITAKF